MSGAQRVACSIFNSAKDNAPQRKELAWTELIDLLKAPDYRAEKLKGPMISPATFEGTRSSANARLVHFGALDIDDKTPDQFASVMRRAERFDSFAHTTWSQAEASPNGLLRCRLFVRLSRPVLAAEWPAVWERLVLEFGASGDPKCRDVGRCYFTPALPIGADWAWKFWEYAPGTAWDVDAALAAGPVRVSTQAHSGPVASADGGPLDFAGADSLSLTPALPMCPRGVDPAAHAVYLATIAERSVSGRGGDGAAFKFALALCRGLALEPACAFQIFKEHFNPRCTYVDGRPYPWSDVEISHKVNDAARSDRKALGYLLEPLPQPEPPSTSNPFNLIGSDAIFAPLEPAEYVIEPLVQRESLTLIAAYGGSGKSWLAIEMCVAAALGRPAFGRFASKQSHVAYLDFENGPYEMRRRVKAIASGRGAQAVRGLAIGCHPRVYLSSPEFEAQVRELATNHELIVIDTLKAASPGSDENDSNIRSGLDALKRVAGETRCAFVVLVHAKKTSGTSEIDPRELLRGSSAIYDAADTVFAVTYKENQPLRINQVKARQGRAIEPFHVAIKDLPTGGVQVMTEAREEKDDAAFEKVCALVLVAVTANPRATTTLIKERAGARASTVAAALETLERREQIMNAGNDKRPNWVLCPAEAVA